MAEQTKRIDAVAKLVMATCIDRVEMNRKGVTYFKWNEELAVDIITVLDSLKTRLHYELKLNFKELLNYFTPLNEIEEEERDNINNSVP